MFYLSRGRVPRRRHGQHRARDGSPYVEELFGTEGSAGRSSLLYHRVSPTRTHRIEPLGAVAVHEADDGVHRQRLIAAAGLPPRGDAITGRVPLLLNADVTMGVVRPAEPMAETLFYRNGEADELLFVDEGSGLFDSLFGPLRYGSGDYIVIPIGTTWRLAPDEGSAQRMVWLECPSAIEPPRRHRNEYGQLLEQSPYSQRDIRVPKTVQARTDEGEFRVHVKARGQRTAYHYATHPFDLVGWDGYLWPYIVNIADVAPSTGRVDDPLSAHDTFEARNVRIRSFAPRTIIERPPASPTPYDHSSVARDEATYTVSGSIPGGRRVAGASFTLHPAGIPHGPHPGTIETSPGAGATEETAVMIETLHPLRMTRQAAGLDDPRYAYAARYTEAGTSAVGRPPAAPD
jgi:homogentisate 1,2-dioxygenase